MRLGIARVTFTKRCGKFLQQGWQIGVLLPVRFDDGAQAAELVECALELFGFDGLEQVVDGVGLEGAQGVLIVGRREDDEGLAVRRASSSKPFMPGIWMSRKSTSIGSAENR